MPAAYASDEKRTVLVQSAKQLLHEQGFARTTLADVAQRSGVPLGNVYYYFKTKEAIAEAVIAAHEADLRGLFASWTTKHREPRERLRRLVRAPLASADSVVHFGWRSSVHVRHSPRRVLGCSASTSSSPSSSCALPGSGGATRPTEPPS
jgi:AcrR family transcriptional regulator